MIKILVVPKHHNKEVIEVNEHSSIWTTGKWRSRYTDEEFYAVTDEIVKHSDTPKMIISFFETLSPKRRELFFIPIHKFGG